MMTKGLLASFKTEIASVIAPWSATLTGGVGQQDTTLHEQTHLESQKWYHAEKKNIKKLLKVTANLTLLLSTFALTMSPAMST